MLVVIQVEALQFEWAWQHPIKSLAVKEAAARIPSSVRGLKKQFYLLFTMLNCDKWSSMDLNVQFLSSKYIDYRKGCPGLPPHMGLSIAPVESLPMNLEEADSELDIGMEKEESRKIPNVEESIDSLLGSEPNFSDIEEDDSDPPTEYQNCRREDIGRPKSLDRTEKQRKPPDAPVIGEAVASSSCASSITQPLVNAMDVSGRQTKSNSVTLGDRRQAVDFSASVEYTLRKAPVDDDELLPIRYRQLSASSVSVQVEAPVPVSLNRIFETSPRARCRPKSKAFQNAQGQSKTKVKSTSEASESRDIEGQSSGYNYDGHRKVPSRQVLSPLPNECGAVASEVSSISPFSAFLERYSVPEPSSIVKRCLLQKSKAYVPVLSDSSVPIRNLSNEGITENLPCTPKCKPRVVVVIPDDTPILSSKEVIDLTDSPY
jgi:hypothetical protein